MELTALLEGTNYQERLDFIGAVAQQLQKELRAPIWAGQPEESLLAAAAQELTPLADILTAAQAHCQAAERVSPQ